MVPGNPENGDAKSLKQRNWLKVKYQPIDSPTPASKRVETEDLYCALPHEILTTAISLQRFPTTGSQYNQIPMLHAEERERRPDIQTRWSSYTDSVHAQEGSL